MSGQEGGIFRMVLHGLHIGYARHKALLTGVDQKVRSGELVALIGLNGSGKSTLLRTMAGLLPPLGGQIYLEGTDLNSYSARERAQKISFVAAGTPAQAALRAWELVALGRLPHTGWMGRYTSGDLEQVDQALRDVGLEGFQERRLERLSDGERQRVMIARALVQDTPVMLLDEPGAFLDLPNKFEMIRILSRIRDQGKTVVYSTHDLETALTTSDVLWVMHKGEVHAGAPEDLGISGIFDAMFAASELRFVVEQQRFRYPVQKRGEIRLNGSDDLLLVWTRKALERLGFETGEAQDLPVIRVDADHSGPKWTLPLPEGVREFREIQHLARCLIQEL